MLRSSGIYRRSGARLCGAALHAAPRPGHERVALVVKRIESSMIEWFDDLKIGVRFKSDATTVSKEDIIRFAREYDPQPFHLDEEAAKKTILGGLAASGWQTAAIAMRLAASCRPFGPHPLFGAGVDDLRWLKPVRPGDSIHLEGEVVELVPSRTKPHGIARVKWTAFNQHGEAVYTFNPIAIVPRRPDQGAQ
jgi:acyl dehydratase